MIKNRICSFILAAALFLGSYRGYIALWDDKKEEPVQIFPCQVSSLPPADQTALEEGIRVKNKEELDQLLEDYLS